MLKVVQAIGAAEDNVLDFGAPKRIDGSAAISLINAAVETGIDQYVMISSLGTGKFGWPAGEQPKKADKSTLQSRKLDPICARFDLLSCFPIALRRGDLDVVYPGNPLSVGKQEGQ